MEKYCDVLFWFFPNHFAWFIEFTDKKQVVINRLIKILKHSIAWYW